MARGEGLTTRQMESAPKGAVFICPAGQLPYAKALAHAVARTDLQLKSVTWLEEGRWRGRELSGIVVDHAVRLTAMQYDALEGALTRVRT